MGRVVEIMNDYLNEIFDINMGCLVLKVVKNGDGLVFMKNFKFVEEVLRVVVKNLKKLVILKIWKGWDDNSVNVVEIVKIVEDCGISVLVIYGRIRE